MLTAKLKLLKEKEAKLLLKRVDQATYSQGIFALVSISGGWPHSLPLLFALLRLLLARRELT